MSPIITANNNNHRKEAAKRDTKPVRKEVFIFAFISLFFFCSPPLSWKEDKLPVSRVLRLRPWSTNKFVRRSRTQRLSSRTTLLLTMTSHLKWLSQFQFRRLSMISLVNCVLRTYIAGAGHRQPIELSSLGRARISTDFKFNVCSIHTKNLHNLRFESDLRETKKKYCDRRNANKLYKYRVECLDEKISIVRHRSFGRQNRFDLN